MADVDYDTICMWKVEALKEYLKKRGLKVSGRKQELVARVFAAVEQNIPVSESAAVLVAQASKEREILLVTPGENLPDPTTLVASWIGESEGMKLWPSIFLCDITMYIMKDHPGNNIPLQRRLLNEYKEGKAYRLYEGGWLKKIQINLLNDSCKYCFLRAKCTPSMKIQDVPHKVWICAEKRCGNIHSAYCSCTAG